MAEHETIADIIAEMRIFKCRNLQTGELELCNAIANYFANRLEAAHKREVDKLNSVIQAQRSAFDAEQDRWRRKHPGDGAAIQLAMCLYNRGDMDEAAGVFGQLAQNSADARIKARATKALQVIWQKQQRRDTK